MGRVAQLCEYSKRTALYTLKGWTLWYVNYTSAKIKYRKEEHIHVHHFFFFKLENHTILPERVLRAITPRTSGREQSFVRRSLSRSTQKDWLLNSTPEEPRGASGCKGSEKSCSKDIYLILCCTLFTKCIWCSWPWTFPTSLSFQWASVSTRAVRYRSGEFNGLSKVTQLSVPETARFHKSNTNRSLKSLAEITGFQTLLLGF